MDSRQRSYAISGLGTGDSDDIHDQMKFIPKPLMIILKSTKCLISLCIALVVPIIEVAIGRAYQDQCTINPNIPVYLIVSGACGMATIGLTLVIVVPVICMIKRKSTAGLIAFGIIIAIILLIIFLMSLFLFAWFIVGNVWVFSARPNVNYDDTSSRNYCHRTLYEFAFAIIILTYVLMAVSCICRCIQGCIRTASSE